MHKREDSWRRALFVVAVTASLACASTKAYQKDVEDANTKGKYKVRLTTDPEVVASCKYVNTIQPNQDPVGDVTQAQYPEYFRVHAVLMGADTVLVREQKFGEAYICGATPLNPDGTPKAVYDTPPQHP
jgi:hypothetical protein